jgi:hypothetical protein
VALAAATKALKRVGMDAIARHEADLTAYALQRLAKVEGVRIYGDADPRRTADRLGVIPFNVGKLSHFLVAAILGTEYGIGVRNGCFCAHPYLTHLLAMTKKEAREVGKNIAMRDLSGMPGMVRISFGMYNTIDEVDVLVDALSDIARGAHKGKYVQDRASGEYQAQGWSPDLAAYFELRTFVPATFREEAPDVRSVSERVSARRTLRPRRASLAAQSA